MAERSFSEEVELLRHFADDIGYGVERLRDRAERERAEREFVRLARIQQALDDKSRRNQARGYLAELGAPVP